MRPLSKAESVFATLFFGLFLSIFCAPKAYAANVGTDTTLNSDTTDTQQNINVDDVTLTNNAVLNLTNANNTVLVQTQDGVTVTNNSGASIINSNSTSAVRGITATNLTVNNSGTIQSTATFGMFISGNSTFTINNNSGATITATNSTVVFTDSGGTLNNSGTIIATDNGSTQAISSGNTSAGLIINNNVGGVITGSGTRIIKLDTGDTVTNFGSITNTGTGNSIFFDENDSTLILKEGSILVGKIDVSTGTGNTIQVEQGYGQTYFYETTGTGTYTVQDLSGNEIVKGSAGSVGQGAQESIDERLGLRTYNLRSALKRYSAFPKNLIEDELYVEPFSYYSERGSNSSILSYENYGYGLNFIYPLKSKEFDLILTVEKSELELQRDHDISNTNFLAGFNAREFLSLGPWKTSGFFVAGMGWHDGNRRILTNATSSGELDVTSDYTSYEVITGINANYIYSSGINTWNTEIGLTSGYSLTPDYEESRYFTWEARQIWQGSIHIGESLTSKVSDNLTVTVGGELEHRSLLRGREQTYAINGTTADTRHGQFWQNSVAGKLGANYSINNNMVAYVNLDSRFSTLARGTYGASAGVKLNF